MFHGTFRDVALEELLITYNAGRFWHSVLKHLGLVKNSFGLHSLKHFGLFLYTLLVALEDLPTPIKMLDLIFALYSS